MQRAYSYIRFSTAIQAKGDSLRRQLELSEKYCRDNGLILDETLVLHDLGVSAYKGLNAAEGKLKAFIDAIDDGKVETGSVLLIESLDRLSREQAISALTLFNSILSKNITIITLSDNKVYTKESINNIGDLMYSLFIMARAHEESLTKSRRISAAWDNKRKLAESEKKAMTKLCVSWLELVDGVYVVKDKQAEIVKEIYDLYIKGYGYLLIEKHLNNHYDTFGFFGRKGKRWHCSYVKKILQNEAVIGIYKGIENYFPAIIKKEDWLKVQVIKKQKAKGYGGRRTGFNNIFTHLCKCAKCGGSMIRFNKTKYVNGNAQVNVGLVCDAGRVGLTDCTSKGWRMDELEEVILKTVSEIDIESIIGTDEEKIVLDALNNSLVSLRFKLDELKNAKENIVTAIAMGGELKVLVNKLKELEEEELSLTNKFEVVNIAYEEERQNFKNVQNAQNQLALLKDKLADSDVRLAVNLALKKIVSRILLNTTTKTFVIEYKNTMTKELLETGRIYTVSEEREFKEGTHKGLKYRIHSIP